MAHKSSSRPLQKISFLQSYGSCEIVSLFFFFFLFFFLIRKVGKLLTIIEVFATYDNQVDSRKHDMIGLCSPPPKKESVFCKQLSISTQKLLKRKANKTIPNTHNVLASISCLSSFFATRYFLCGKSTVATVLPSGLVNTAKMSHWIIFWSSVPFCDMLIATLSFSNCSLSIFLMQRTFKQHSVTLKSYCPKQHTKYTR